MRVAITGATGLLGRNILFEFLKQHITHLDALEVIVLGRDKNEQPLGARMNEIVLSDGADYLSNTKGFSQGDLERWRSERLTCVEMDLKQEGLAFSDDGLQVLKRAPIDFIIHSAAITDFRDKPHVIERLHTVNVRGTEQILELVRSLHVREFIYVGSAYATGMKTGLVASDFVDLAQVFRNPYELSKLQAEVQVRTFAPEARCGIRYVRPTTICGRLMEPTIGSVCKFDVFYAWAAFMLFNKLMLLGEWQDKYTDPFDLDFRVCYSKQGGLNIIPVDFAAKVMYQICMQGNARESYYVANPHDTPHSLYVSLMLETLNIRGVQVVDEIPTEQNEFETFYYEHVGKVFTPYVISPEKTAYDLSNLENILRRANLTCPPIDRENFLVLMEYGKQRDFGLKLETVDG